MKFKHILILAVLGSVLFADPSEAAPPTKEAAAEAKKTAPKKAEPKGKQDTYPFYAKVVAITSRTLTVVRSDAADAEQSKFAVNASTEYVDGEKPATIEAVKVGSWIGGTLKKAEADGNDTVVRLNVGVKQKTAKKAAKATKKKTDTKSDTKGETKKKAE
jgi:hypothetical protein